MMNIKALYHNMLLYRTCKGSFTYGHGWFIISNTGAVKESTSAEYASKTEQAIHSDAVQDSQQVQNLSVNQRIRRKDDDEESSDKKQQSEKEEEEFQDGLVEKIRKIYWKKRLGLILKILKIPTKIFMLN